MIAALCLCVTACGKNTEENVQVSETEAAAETQLSSETEAAAETQLSSETEAAASETQTPSETEAVTAETTAEKIHPESDEVLVRGQEFAEAYAEMSWDYLHGAAWEDYVDTAYFDFDDKSEGNYFEEDGIPFYRLLITEYTYDELTEHIKSFHTAEAYSDISAEGMIFTGRDNCIYVNGNEPTFIYSMRCKRAVIVGYTQAEDGSVVYDCFAQAEEDSEDLYFSFTLDPQGKLCGGNTDIMYMELFSERFYPESSDADGQK